MTDNIGKRCVLSKLGRENESPARYFRKGVIMGEKWDGTCYYVRWDGNSTNSVFAKAFIQTIEDDLVIKNG